MTEGHRHRTLHLPAGSARLHLLQTPLARTANPDRANKSRWVWGAEQEPVAGDGPVRYATTYVLTPLSILHTITGLTIHTTPQDTP